MTTVRVACNVWAWSTHGSYSSKNRFTGIETSAQITTQKVR